MAGKAKTKGRFRCHALNHDGEPCDCEEYEEKRKAGKCACQHGKSQWHWIDEDGSSDNNGVSDDQEDDSVDTYYDNLFKKAGGESALRRQTSASKAVKEAQAGFRPLSPKKTRSRASPVSDLTSFLFLSRC